MIRTPLTDAERELLDDALRVAATQYRGHSEELEGLLPRDLNDAQSFAVQTGVDLLRVNADRIDTLLEVFDTAADIIITAPEA